MRCLKTKKQHKNLRKRQQRNQVLIENTIIVKTVFRRMSHVFCFILSYLTLNNQGYQKIICQI